jgi:hypothetical protein
MRRTRRAVVRPTLAHGVMVLAGLATFALVSATLRDRSATVPVAVAAGSIEAGTPLGAAPLATVEVGAGSELLGTLVRADHDRSDLVISRALQPGEPLLAGDLLAGTDAGGLRTVTLPVERLVIDGLGLRAGDRVDVIAVQGDGTSRFVAVDVGVARLPGDAALTLGRADTATTWLTIAVTDRQALAVAGAAGRGQVVVVRSTGAAPTAAWTATVEVDAGPILEADGDVAHRDGSRPSDAEPGWGR